MNDLFVFTGVCALLLAAPGPTNALLAASAAMAGARSALPLVPVVLAAYALSIGALLLLLAPIAAAYPAVSAAVKLAGAAYLVWLATKLWRGAPAISATAIGPVEVFIATLLNPKAFIFAFVVFPGRAGAGLARDAAIFAALVLICGGAWVMAGGALHRTMSGRRGRLLVSRVSATAIAALAILVAASAF